MAHRYATKPQIEADDMDARLFAFAERAHSLGERDVRWREVAKHIDGARNALLPCLHPEDRKIAASA